MSDVKQENESVFLSDELQVFSLAKNWRRYFLSHIVPHLGRRVLEVGAGIGSNTRELISSDHLWMCLEPEHGLAQDIEAKIEGGEIPANCKVMIGTLNDIPSETLFDAILYIDVLEHIQDHEDELRAATKHLAPGGCLIVMSPAHQFLFSAFDAQIGHWRRYNKSSLLKIAPMGLELVALKYLDSIGLFASLANRIFLKQSNPTMKQIRFWDQKMIPVSRIIDKFLGYHFGKSILAVWQMKSGQGQRK